MSLSLSSDVLSQLNRAAVTAGGLLRGASRIKAHSCVLGVLDWALTDGVTQFLCCCCGTAWYILAANRRRGAVLVFVLWCVRYLGDRT
jgi:hypothetical protein